MAARWRIELLGGLRAIQGDQAITRFRTRKTAALLAYLAYHPQRSHSREVLIEMLWPEGDPEGGRSRLSVALSSLRDQLEPPGVAAGAVLVADRYSVGLNPSAVTTDAARFEAALESAGEAQEPTRQIQALIDAVELYRGELLPGFYEDWIFPERQRLEERFFQALRRLIEALERQGDLDRAIQYAHRAVSADPLREETHHELIRLYAAAGKPSAALWQYRELERLLKQELDAAPGPDTRALVRTVAEEARGVAWEAAETLPAPSPPSVSTSLSSSPTPPLLPSSQLEPIGGAVPLTSAFYIERPTDAEFGAAIARKDSIVLVKGTRQVGKTSLLVRGLQQARQAGARVVLTDFQMLNASHLESAESVLLALAQSIADQLDLDTSPADVWDVRRGPNPNFRRFLEREVLGTLSAPLLWGLDQVDRLFSCDFGPDLFGLFRSWHNERAFNPSGPWSRLTLVIAYATEAHLVITDADQSPFNVGTRLALEDFTPEHVAELNRRYGAPLQDKAELARFYRLLSGHPYLVRRGLHEMASHGTGIAAFEARAGSAEWIYGDHLRRLLMLLTRDPELCDVVRVVDQGRSCPTLESFYRLRSAGVVVGTSERDVHPRCELYATYLRQHLL